MKLHSTLYTFECFNRRSGYKRQAFRFVDHETGAMVEGTASGDNIGQIRLYWNGTDGWDGGFLTSTVTQGEREWERYTKGWQHAGCGREDLQQFIVDGLRKQGVTVADVQHRR